MKKLLLILLCLPMIGFGQIMGLGHYLPSTSTGAGLSGGSGMVAAGYIPLANHVYTDLPDSIYGNTYTVDSTGQPTFASGHMYYHPGTLLGSEWTLNGLPYFQIFSSNILNNNNLIFASDWFSAIDSATNHGVDTFFYDANNNLIKTVMHSTFTWNSIPPQVWNEQHNIVEYTFNANNQISQIDFTHYLLAFGTPTTTTETNYLYYDGSGRLLKVELPFNSELRYNYGNYGVSSVDLYQNNNYIDKVSNSTYDANGIISENVNTPYMLQPLTNIETLRYIINHDANGWYTYSSHELWNPVSNNWDMQNEWYYLYNSQTAINEISNLDRAVLKITDALGREIKGKKNQPLFYIYNDGTVEKRIVID